MSRQNVENILRAWRELERELETTDDEGREEIEARIRELRDQYQAAVGTVEVDAGRIQGAAGTA